MIRQLKHLLTGAALAAALALSGQAFAQGFVTGQPTQAPPVPNTHSSDEVPCVSYGMGSPACVATMGQVQSQQTYTTQVPLTGFTITAPNPNTATFLLLNPAGTLATGTLTMPSAPSDGGSFCVMSTQTQTALTVNANTGQTMGGAAVTALTAYQPKCWRWFAALGTWDAGATAW